MFECDICSILAALEGKDNFFKHCSIISIASLTSSHFIINRFSFWTSSVISSSTMSSCWSFVTAFIQMKQTLPVLLRAGSYGTRSGATFMLKGNKTTVSPIPQFYMLCMEKYQNFISCLCAWPPGTGYSLIWIVLDVLCRKWLLFLNQTL